MLPFGIGFSEVLLILVVVLLVVGPAKLPELAKSMAKGLRTVRNAGRELRDAIDVEEVREIKRSLYNPMSADWRDEWPQDADDAEFVPNPPADARAELTPDPETLHQKPAEAPSADEPRATEAEAPQPSAADETDDPAEGRVARDPYHLVRKAGSDEPIDT